MKKLFVILLAFVMAAAMTVTFAACGDEKDNKPGPEPSVSTDPEPGESTEPTVEPDKDITGITFADKTVVYNGEEHEVTVSGTLPQGVSVTYAGNKATNAGTYSASATLRGNGYKELTLNAVLTVAKADAVIEAAADQRIAYTGEPVTVSAVLAEGVGELSYSQTPADVGTYTVTVAVAASSNYNGASIVVNLEIYDDTSVTPQLELPDLQIAGLEKIYTGEALAPDVAGIPADVDYKFVDGVGAEISMVETGTYTIYLLASKDGYKDYKSESYTFVISPQPETAGYNPLGMTDKELKDAWRTAELTDAYSAAYIGLDYSSHGTIWAVTETVFNELQATSTLSTTDLSGKWNMLNRANLVFAPQNSDGSYGEFLAWNHPSYSAGSNLYNDPFFRSIDGCYFLWHAGNCSFIDAGMTDGQGFRFGWGYNGEVHSVEIFVTTELVCELSGVKTPSDGRAYEISKEIYESFVLTENTVADRDTVWTEVTPEKAGIAKWCYSFRAPNNGLYEVLNLDGVGVVKKFSEMADVELYAATDGEKYYVWIKNYQASPIVSATFSTSAYGFPHTYGILFWYNEDGELCEQAIKVVGEAPAPEPEPEPAQDYRPLGMTDEQLKAAWQSAEFKGDIDAVYVGGDFSSQGTIWAVPEATFNSMAVYITSQMDNHGKWNMLNRLNFYIGSGSDVSQYIPWNNATLNSGTAYYGSLYLREVEGAYFLWFDANASWIGMGFKDGDSITVSWGADMNIDNSQITIVFKDNLLIRGDVSVTVPEAGGKAFSIPAEIAGSFVLTQETLEAGGLTWTKIDSQKIGMISHTYCSLCGYLPILETFAHQTGVYNRLAAEMGEGVALYIAEVDGEYYLWFEGLDSIRAQQYNVHGYGVIYWYDVNGEFCMQEFKYTDEGQNPVADLSL